MRGGSESFLIKDSAYYQSKMTAAIGVSTERVYEELRSHVWRSRNKGNGKLRSEVENGRLSAHIRRQSIATATGLSIKTVQRRLNVLRDIGWVRSVNGQPMGEALVYELGYTLQGGVEVFYADVDCREFHLHLERVAEERESDVSHIPDKDRVELARRWMSNKNKAVREGGSQSPTPWVTESHPTREGGSQRPSGINNPAGEEINKPVNIDRAQERAKDSQTGPVPKTFAVRDRDSKTKKKSRPSRSNRGTSKKKTNSEAKTHENGVTTFALDDSGDARLAGAKAAEAEGKAKADKQVVADARRRNRARRTEKMDKKVGDEQRAQNLRGGGTVSIHKESRRLWGVLQDLLQEFDADFPRTDWKAKANTKARGQMTQLVELYGGEAVERAMTYMVRNWEVLTGRYFKNGSRGFPNLGALLALHETLFRESIIWSRHAATLEEWETWKKDNPGDFYPPDDLKARRLKARKELEALGF